MTLNYSSITRQNFDAAFSAVDLLLLPYTLCAGVGALVSTWKCSDREGMFDSVICLGKSPFSFAVSMLEVAPYHPRFKLLSNYVITLCPAAQFAQTPFYCTSIAQEVLAICRQMAFLYKCSSADDLNNVFTLYSSAQETNADGAKHSLLERRIQPWLVKALSVREPLSNQKEDLLDIMKIQAKKKLLIHLIALATLGFTIGGLYAIQVAAHSYAIQTLFILQILSTLVGMLLTMLSLDQKEWVPPLLTKMLADEITPEELFKELGFGQAEPTPANE